MNKEKWIKLAKVIGVTISVYLVFKYILPLVTPFVIAFLIALVLEKPVAFLEKKNVKRVISATALLCTGVTVIGTFVWIICSNLLKQIKLFVEDYPGFAAKMRVEVCDLCERVDSMIGADKGDTLRMVEKNADAISSSLEETVVPSLVNKSIPIMVYIVGAIGVILITLIAVVLFSVQMNDIKNACKNSVFANEIKVAADNVGKIGIAYVKTQGIIMLITALLCTVGFYIIGNRYALLIGVIVGVLDAFPLFGSGVILVPWAVILMIRGKYWQGATIFTLFLVCYIVRQVLEPKLMGGKLGVGQLEMLISIYAGLLLFGLFGFILGPVGYIIIHEVCSGKSGEN